MPARQVKPMAAALALAIGALSLTSCAARQQVAQQPPPPPPVQQPLPPAPKPTDPQIVDIVYTAGQIEIDTARLALRNWHNHDVDNFANEMVRDHTFLDRRLLALTKKLHIIPEDNDISRSLKQQADDTKAHLAGLRGGWLKRKEFDRAYAENAVSFHQKVNSLLQDTLIPNAQNPELKRLLQRAQRIYFLHQGDAQRLVTNLH